MNRFPALFVSHGAPTLAIEPGPAHEFLRELGPALGRPEVIVVASAHHTGRPLTITASPCPGTIHDFRGFPESLNAMRYPAPGAPEVADHIEALLKDAGFDATTDTQRGLDHGAWVPLHLMYPEADIPVVQVAIDPSRGAHWHESLGAALSPLRDNGALLIGSGSATHDLAAFFGSRAAPDASAPEWVTDFTDWLADRLAGNDRDAVRHAIERGPHGRRNHPTPEHLLPLHVAMGAAPNAAGARRLHQSTTHAVLAMDVYAFDDT